MITIRTGLVIAAFVAMGLTSVAEHLAEQARRETDPAMSIGMDEAMPGKALWLTQRIQPDAQNPDLSPWI